MQERIAVYAGTFDPLTFGHLWMIEQGATLFDKLIVAIGTNPEKQKDIMFSVRERVEMIKKSTERIPNIEVSTFANQFLIRYVQSMGAKFLLRGIRNEGDYEYERGMRHVNSDLDPVITTVFLMPPRNITEVSSSMVKDLIGPAGWEAIIEKYVPEAILEKLKEKHYAKSR